MKPNYKKIFELVKSAAENNAGVEYDEFSTIENSYYLEDHCDVLDNEFRLFTKGFVVSVTNEIVFDDIDKEKGKWHRHYSMSNLSRLYGNDTDMKLEDILLWIKKYVTY